MASKESIPRAGPPPPSAVAPAPVLTLERLRSELGDAKVRQHLATVRAHVANGDTDEKISEEHRWPIEAVRVLRAAVVTDEIVAMKRPTEEVFADYVLRQEGCVRDLNDVIERYKAEVKAAHVVVGAIKARSEILDRVVMRGQEFGVLRKAPQRREILQGNIDIASLPPHKMRGLVREQLKALQKLSRMIGDVGPEHRDGIVIPIDGGDGDNEGKLSPAERRKRIAGRGVDRARAARVKVRAGLVRRVKGTDAPGD